MKNYLLLIVLLFVGCNESTLGDMFSEISNEYKIGDRDCYVKISGSKVSAVDNDGSPKCSYVDEYGDLGETWTEKLEIDGAISDDKISGTLTYFASDYDDGQTQTQTATIEGAIAKHSSRDEEGRFAALAGEWSGTLTVRENWQIQSNDGEELEEGEADEEVYELRIDASGIRIDVQYRSENDSEWTTFSVIDKGDDGLLVNGEIVDIR